MKFLFFVFKFVSTNNEKEKKSILLAYDRCSFDSKMMMIT